MELPWITTWLMQQENLRYVGKDIRFFIGNTWNSQLSPAPDVKHIPRNMHTDFALLCFVVVIHWLIFLYPSGLLHWHCGNRTIAPVPAKQPWWIWMNTTTKQSTTKPCAYFLGYTVLPAIHLWQRDRLRSRYITHMLGCHILDSSVPGQNDRHFADDITRCVFLNETLCILIKISPKCVPKGSIDNILPLGYMMAWRRIGDKPLSEPMLARFTDTTMRG